MPFNIIQKPKGSSNKHYNLVHFANLSPSQEVLPGEHPTPIIDKLTVTLTVPTKEHGIDMWKGHWTEEKDGGTFKPVRPSKGYNKAYRIALQSIASSKAWPFYEIAFDNACITKVRLDIIPADLGPEGLFELHTVLMGLMDSGWGFFVRHGKITRLDVAVDLPHLEMDHLLYLPKKGLTSWQWLQSGKLGSYQLGKPKGNSTMIYDRKQKRVDKGKPWAGKEGIRVERRLKNLGMPLKGLSGLSWPFADLQLVRKIATPPSGEPKAYFWRQFLMATDHCGLAAAMANLPPKKRTMYRKHLHQHKAPMWDARVIWANWHTMLDELKLSHAGNWV